MIYVALSEGTPPTPVATREPRPNKPQRLATETTSRKRSWRKDDQLIAARVREDRFIAGRHHHRVAHATFARAPPVFAKKLPPTTRTHVHSSREPHVRDDDDDELMPSLVPLPTFLLHASAALTAILRLLIELQHCFILFSNHVSSQKVGCLAHDGIATRTRRFGP